MRVLLFDMVVGGQADHSLAPVCEWLDERDVAYVMYSDEAFKDGHDQKFQDLQDSVAGFDLVCSFGGDGTTLRAAHAVGTSETPLLSINLGHLGFLAGAGTDDLFAALEAAVSSELTADPRSILKAKISYQDGSVENHIAFNELVVSRGHFGRIVSLDVAINNNYLDTISGDGVLVSTPTGSTAYSLSAGGPIIAPDHEGLCVVPISPHSLASRAVITTKDDIIEIMPNAENRQKLVLFIDGEVFWIHPNVRLGIAELGTVKPSAAGSGAAELCAANPGASEPIAKQIVDDSRGEIVSVEIGVSDKKLNLRRFGSYDFYTHISKVFFRGSHA